MGTRADFYVGTGPKAEWLGSVAWDGYEWEETPDCPLMKAKTEEAFRQAVDVIAKSRRDFTTPDLGWPWPWEDSRTTDRAYAFVDGATNVYHWGGRPVVTINEDGDKEYGDPIQDCEWPNMKAIQKVTLGYRSGVIAFVIDQTDQ